MAMDNYRWQHHEQFVRSGFVIAAATSQSVKYATRIKRCGFGKNPLIGHTSAITTTPRYKVHQAQFVEHVDQGIRQSI